MFHLNVLFKKTHIRLTKIQKKNKSLAWKRHLSETKENIIKRNISKVISADIKQRQTY